MTRVLVNGKGLVLEGSTFKQVPGTGMVLLHNQLKGKQNHPLQSSLTLAWKQLASLKLNSKFTTENGRLEDSFSFSFPFGIPSIFISGRVDAISFSTASSTRWKLFPGCSCCCCCCRGKEFGFRINPYWKIPSSLKKKHEKIGNPLELGNPSW